MKVLVAAWIGSTNLGDEMIFGALRRKLSRRGAEVIAISVDPLRTRRQHPGAKAVSHTDLPTLIRIARRSDALVFGGGGLLQDETSAANLPYHLSRVWLARWLRIPFAAVGVGAGRLDSALGRLLVGRSLRQAIGITARDPASAELLCGLGLPDVRTAADLAVSLPERKLEAADRIAVCLRPYAAETGGLRPVSWRRGPPLPDGIAVTLAAALDAVARSTEAAIHFVAFQADRDDPVHRRVAARMCTPSTAAVPADPERALDEVARCRIVVAMRYHGGLAALLAGRPAVLLSYSPKVRSLAAELGTGGMALGLRDDELSELPRAIDAVAGREPEVLAARARLRKRDAINDQLLDRLLARR